jgi:hypothetical protein
VNATEVKDALRARHPATVRIPGATLEAPGMWTTVEEWHGIDFLAFSAWQSPKPAIGVANPIVGYEVKVSRSDYRRELANPHKRAGAVRFCNAFYFAVPDGLLKPDELAWDEPDWAREHEAWQRVACPGDERGRCYRGKQTVIAIGPLREHQSWRDWVEVRCETCGGKGYLERSRVEKEAPTLWVPVDVGLVVVLATGKTKVLRKAPIRPTNGRQSIARSQLTDLVRWLSVRPDPRHAACRNGAMP